SRACAALRRTRPDWRVKSYDAKWQATLIEANGKTAHVAFGGGKWPDCDVRLEFDQLRQKWKVRAVERGGFPPGLQW
ncbi:MAG: hypothetical protein KGL35_23180, partial [Bradyrhizobium sp.]|nr:hypothetical protein [Bradyrhizobium sp.]